MLKAHQACIDLLKNVLRIQGREVAFLAEHELPDKARLMNLPVEESSIAGPSALPESSSSAPQLTHFPGHGNTLGSAPSVNPNTRPQAPIQQQQSRSGPVQFPQSDIDILVGLGATPQQAQDALQSAGGNVESAAAFLFG